MKKVKKLFTLLMVMCTGVCALSIVGCKKEPNNELPVLPKNCEIIVEATLYSGLDNCKDFSAICNTFAEFKEICLNNGCDFFDVNNKENNFYDTDAGKKIRKYTNEYFKNKAFVVCAFNKSTLLGQYRVEEVEVTASKLILYIKEPKSDSAQDVINYVFMVSSVDKSLLSGVTQLEYVIR